MTWEEYLNSNYNKITDSTTITYNNKKIKMKDYIEKELENRKEWIENCQNNSDNTACPPYTNIKYNNINLFAINYIENGVLNISGYNPLPNCYYYKNNNYNYFDSKLLESEIMDSSQGCYYSER